MNSTMLRYAMTIMLLSLLMSVPALSQAQTANTATDSTKSDSMAVDGAVGTEPQTIKQKDPAVSHHEIVLEEIKIEAIIETPSVAIVPKRLKPDFGKMEFVDRSFEKELKAIPKKPMLNSDDLNGVNKIKTRKVDELKTE